MYKGLHRIPEQFPGAPSRQQTSSGIAVSVRVRLFLELLRAVELTAPVIGLSAMRSGSTQLGRYPDARFLSVLREPPTRIRGAVNFVALAPDMAGLGQ